MISFGTVVGWQCSESSSCYNLLVMILDDWFVLDELCGLEKFEFAYSFFEPFLCEKK